MKCSAKTLGHLYNSFRWSTEPRSLGREKESIVGVHISRPILRSRTHDSSGVCQQPSLQGTFCGVLLIYKQFLKRSLWGLPSCLAA